MSYFDYTASRKILANDPPFYALIMAAMGKADSVNQAKLQAMWPDVWAEANARYNAPGAKLPEEWEAEGQSDISGHRPGCRCAEHDRIFYENKEGGMT